MAESIGGTALENNVIDASTRRFHYKKREIVAYIHFLVTRKCISKGQDTRSICVTLFKN